MTTSRATASENNFISAQKASRLLTLPRELRDEIYEYALTNDDGRIEVRQVDHDDSEEIFLFRYYTVFRPWRREDVNQLQYVCWQLRHETRGLSFKLNTLSFRGSSDRRYYPHGLIQCSEFLSAFPISQQSRIKHIVILEDFDKGFKDEDWTVALERFNRRPLHNFCNANPDARITVRYNWLEQATSARVWTLYGVALHGLICGYLPEVLNDYDQSLAGLKVVEWGPIKTLPGNLRVALSWGPFEKETFRDWTEYGLGNEKWIRLTRLWCGDGLRRVGT